MVNLPFWTSGLVELARPAKPGSKGFYVQDWGVLETKPRNQNNDSHALKGSHVVPDRQTIPTDVFATLRS